MEVPLREQFMNQYSEKSKRTYRGRFMHFVKYIESLGIRRMQDVKKMHIEQWAKEVVEPEQFRKETKNRHYSLIRQYFEYLADNDVIESRLKLKMRWEFTDFISQEIIERDAKVIPEIFDIVKLLQHAKKINPRMYIYLVLMATNGPRDSEIRSIKLEDIHDIDAEIRTEQGIKQIHFTYFTSGMVEEHMKKGQVIYFVHPNLRESLEWKLYWKQIHFYHSPEFLFQTANSSQFITYKSTSRNIRKYAAKINLSNLRWSTHIFRNVLNESRMHQGVDPALRAILLNQQTKEVNASHYLKKCRQIQNRYLYWLNSQPKKLQEIF